VTIKRPRSAWREKLTALRQRFILTRQEKKVIVFVFAVFVLGLGAKCYRDNHPQPAPSIDKRHPWRKQQMPPSSPSSRQKGSLRKSAKESQSTPSSAKLFL
jgi:hypothetical protein